MSHVSTRADRRAAPAAQTKRAAHNLVDLMYEGFYALFLLRHGCGPHDRAGFGEHMAGFLADVDKKAKQSGVNADDVDAAKYAFCAAVDEIILRSNYEIRNAWEKRPLQLSVFGEQLAGEHFFTKLEDLRARGSERLAALEVFHMCLLLGFQGRYALDGEEKLGYLSERLGDEIARIRGKNRGFAPHALRPDDIANQLRSDLSLWILLGMFALAGLGAFLGFRATLVHHADQALAGYNDLVKLPPRAANVTITLP
ncbi:MAG: type IVB secretion system protein IcmH/DotU [Pseudomonadota bacterium]